MTEKEELPAHILALRLAILENVNLVTMKEVWSAANAEKVKGWSNAVRIDWSINAVKNVKRF